MLRKNVNIQPVAEPSTKKKGTPTLAVVLLLENSSGLGQPTLTPERVSIALRKMGRDYKEFLHITLLTLIIYFLSNLDCKCYWYCSWRDNNYSVCFECKDFI